MGCVTGRVGAALLLAGDRYCRVTDKGTGDNAVLLGNGLADVSVLLSERLVADIALLLTRHVGG